MKLFVYGHLMGPEGLRDLGRLELDQSDSNIILGQEHVHIYDRTGHDVERISRSSAGGQTSHDDWLPAISGDASVVAYDTYSDNIIPTDTNGGDLLGTTWLKLEQRWKARAAEGP